MIILIILFVDSDEADIVSELKGPETITVAPVCEQWQKAKSLQFQLDFVRSNGVQHDTAAKKIPVTQDLRATRIKGDGNCLFRAFSQVISGSQENHTLLRKITVSYIESNIDMFNAICPNVTDHLKSSNMATDGVWGTEVEIFALATLLGNTVYVYSSCGLVNKWVPYAPLRQGIDNHCHEIILLKNLSAHFEPAVL